MKFFLRHPVDDIIRSEIATTMYNSLNGLVPEYLSNLFRKKSTQNVRKVRNTDTDLSLSLRKTNNEQRAVTLRGPKLLNQLELDAKQAPSFATFKRRIKTNYDDRSMYLPIRRCFCNGPPKSSSHGLTVPTGLSK